MDELILEKELEMNRCPGLHQRKHETQLRFAKELLTGNIDPTPKIQNDLSCGKFTRLLKYIFNGSTVIILGIVMSEAIGT